jgi:steroid delta-isomerase-like uncharacterized protein
MLGLQEISERAPHTATLRRVYDEILNEGKLELAEDLVAENAVDHAPDRTSSLPTGGPDRLQAFVATFCVAFPDAYWTIIDLDEEDDLVTIRTVVTGTHHDEFLDIWARGRELVLPGIDLVRVRSGKIVEHWGELDVETMRAQLDPRGVARPPEGRYRDSHPGAQQISGVGPIEILPECMYREDPEGVHRT